MYVMVPKPVLIHGEFPHGMNKRILSKAERLALPSLTLGPCMSLLLASSVLTLLSSCREQRL